MHDTMLKLYVRMQNLMSSDEGQDLVEYALVVALLSLGATAALGTLAGTITSTFTAIGTKLTTAMAT